MQITETHVSQLKLKQADLINLVTGKDRGRDVWYYVQFENKAKHFMFSARSKTDTSSVTISNYGVILRSGWGKVPPNEITKELQEQYS